MTNESYDVVVVGGGPAGLSGAVALLRSRRSVLVVDAGEPRNRTAAHLHNYLGRESASPADLLADGRATVTEYGGEVRSGEAVTAVASEHRRGFTVTLADGSEVDARRLLVTTGLVDELPAVPGLAERWGRDVLHCAYCHGWEVRDQAVGVLATNGFFGHAAQLFRQLSDDVTVFLHGREMPKGEELDALTARGIRLVPGVVEEVLVEDDRLVGVRLDSGEQISREALVVSPYAVARSGLLESLGLELTDVEMNGVNLGQVVASEPGGTTSVPGVWLAGNVTELNAQVISSAAAGLMAGAQINMDLITEETHQALHDTHGRQEMFEQPGWDDRYAAKPAVWSGGPNPQLVAEATGIEPGTALDVGSGEGADAIWLADRGWAVTGLDFSHVALERSAGHAAHAGVAERTTWRHADIRTWESNGEQWDLVTSQYMHQPDGGMLDVVRRLAAAVAPGGTLLVVGHHPTDMSTGLRWNAHDALFEPDELRPALDPDDWDVTTEVRDREARSPDGKREPVTVNDSVLIARRRD